ncbi:hypothetical protein DL93DRAFT_2087889 [Clavulina sp. PMI_390]|nr:hypothetical protein DL93DRAFT_2087889 [Clavulina sp. PMI_390]
MSESLFKKRTAKASSRKRQLSPEADEAPNPSAEAAEGSTSAEAVPSGEDIGSNTEKVDLQELIALRKLQKSQARIGIDAKRLNRGAEVKKKAVAPAEEEQQYGLQPGAKMTQEAPVEDGEDEESKARKIVRSNNFTQQTNALDVDKHMMAYIEEGLKARRGDTGTSDEAAAADAPYDPHEELFKIDERYKLEKRRVQEEDEGNITNSIAMLTAIPEVDLGMDVRLKNIEATEKAKQHVADERRSRWQQGGSSNEPDLGATRFFRHHNPQQSDNDALRAARLQAQGVDVQEQRRQPRGDRRETATDEQVMERFKKRMRK